MNKIENFKIYLGKCHLKSRLKVLKRKTKVYNFDTAKTAGILFSSPDEQSFEHIKEFISFLKSKNIEVTSLGYFPGKKIPDKYLLHPHISLFSKMDLNWYYKPVNASIEQFIQTKFNIFFDLTIYESFPVQFIRKLSNASFKVGKETTENSDYDLMFNIGKNKSLDFLIEQIKHYLAMINNNVNA
ncbi:MAG: hypothetical protein A2041_01640 [Bacteroidetes bacterium GWA2_31_9b]|nr:MAG: hypothetical protein A2041_01640 [Bacteroidetes bacterium GWA2_31_9b]